MTIPSELYYVSFPTGSNYICDPPVTGTDIDTAYYVKDLTNTAQVLKEQGWVECGNSEYGYEGWAAFRKGVDNAICFAFFDDYVRFEAATELAKKKNLLDKEERIELFTIICPRAAKAKPINEVARTQERIAQDEREMVNVAIRALEAQQRVQPVMPTWRIDNAAVGTTGTIATLPPNALRELMMLETRDAMTQANTTTAQLHPNDARMRELRTNVERGTWTR